MVSSFRLNSDRRRAILRFVDQIEDHARHEERREHRREQTDAQRDGESLDRARSPNWKRKSAEMSLVRLQCR